MHSDALARHRWPHLCLAAGGLVLLSCGGESPTDTPPDGGPSLPSASGQVTLPDALAGPVTDYTARSPYGTSALGADGAFTLPVFSNGPTLVWLENGTGQLVLYGFADPAASGAISSLETAAALLFWGLGGHLFPDEESSGLLDFLRAQAVTNDLAEDVEAALGDDTAVMETADSAVRAALLDALSSIERSRAAPIRTLRGGGGGFVEVTPADPQSGLAVDRMPDEAALRVRTDRARSGYYYFYLKEYVDEFGGSHTVDPPQLLGEGKTPFPSLFARTFTEFGLGALEDAVLDPPVAFVPEDDHIRQVYDFVVVGAHVPDLTPEAPWVATHTNPDRDLWRTHAERMPALGFVKEVLLPTLFSVTLPRALREVELNLTAEGAQAFVDEMGAYEPTLAAMIRAGDWQLAAITLLRRYAEDDDARGDFRGALNGWTGLTFDIGADALLDLWLMLRRAETYFDAILEGFENFDVAGVAAAAREAERMDIWEVTFDTASIALATGRGYVSRELNELRVRPIIPREPEAYCVRYVLDGPGALAEWVNGEAPEPAGDELWTDGQIVYVVDPGEIATGTSVTITAELYEELCKVAPKVEPVGTAEAVIEHRELDLDPCKEFDLEFWQEGPSSPDWTFSLLTPIISGGDDIVIEVSSHRNTPSEVTLYIPCVYVHDGGTAVYPGTDDVVVEGAGPNVNPFVVDDGPLWHWRRGDIPVTYPLVSWGIILRIQSVSPLATFTVTVPTSREYSESASFNPCPRFGPWGPGETSALGDLGFISESNGNWFDRLVIAE